MIEVAYSCISSGTEASVVQASGASLITRALEQPGKLKKAARMVVVEGVSRTIAKARGDDGFGQALGYSVAGVVAGLGDGVADLRPGDSVAAAGAAFAHHADYVDVPRHLVAPVPPTLELNKASTVAVGSIALQGARRAALQIGEFVVVFGCGLLGLLTLQIARQAGCRCIAVDIISSRLALARLLGAELTVNSADGDGCVGEVLHFTGGHGADATIFTAAASDPSALSQALTMTRKKGRLVMVGVYGEELHREDIYQKEIDFLISTSYGPGRYDDEYERKGNDYPYSYVRWTENRNMQEYLRLLSTGEVDVTGLIQAVYPIERVGEAFAALQAPERPLLVLLDYRGRDRQPTRTLRLSAARCPPRSDRIRVGLIGAGSFARNVHLPNLARLSKMYEVAAVCSRTGTTAKSVALQFGARYATTDPSEVFKDPAIDLVLICTRHNLHGGLVLASLRAGKHTFVEKPLCITRQEIEALREFFAGVTASTAPSASAERMPLLMVGYNRRFSPFIQEVKSRIQRRSNPLFIHYRMNAGYLPPEHWVHGPEGGGRIAGEACHIVDLFGFLIESPVRTVTVAGMTARTRSVGRTDNKAMTFEYEDGSVAVLEYFSVGSTGYPKELLEVHYDQKTIVVDDYRSITGYGVDVHNLRTRQSEKGQAEELVALGRYLRGEEPEWPIPLADLLETTAISLMAQHESQDS